MSMVMNADGEIGDYIHLTNEASKGQSGRIIALNKELRKQLLKVEEMDGIARADADDLSFGHSTGKAPRPRLS